MSHATAVI